MSALSDAIAQSQTRGACETAQILATVAGQVGLALLSLLVTVPAAADPATCRHQGESEQAFGRV